MRLLWSSLRTSASPPLVELGRFAGLYLDSTVVLLVAQLLSVLIKIQLEHLFIKFLACLNHQTLKNFSVNAHEFIIAQSFIRTFTQQKKRVR